MRSSLVLLCRPLATAVLLCAPLAACIDAPPELGPSLARLVVAWDPLACGGPHRVAVELETDDGVQRAASAPCNLGSLAVDVSQFGTYHGRIYAWALDAAIRSVVPIEVTIDRAVVRLEVATPP